MQYLVVIDTNVIVSALLSKHPDASTVQVFQALLTDRITPVYNDEILTEYSDVLHRTIINYFLKYGICTDRISTGEDLPDPKDLVFYEVCMSKQDKHAMLVTGNMKHFPSKPFIVTPNELLEIINK